MNVIVAHWKKLKATGVYSSLVSFCNNHKEYSYHTLSHYLSRKKVNFEDEMVMLEKKKVIKK